MRKIEVQKFEVLKVDTKEIIKMLVSKTGNGQEGFNVQAVKLALGILDKLEKIADEILLTESEWSFVRARLNTWQWPQVTREILVFITSIEEAQSVPAEKPKEKLKESDPDA